MFKLSSAPTGVPCRVRALHASAERPALARELEDIGFHAGAPVLVMVRGFPGGDPLAVRIGESTFALRAAEAACIEVEALGG
jgi:ferrous iron transport protein A